MQPDSSSPAETPVLREDGISITSRIVWVGGTAYAVRGIQSVYSKAPDRSARIGAAAFAVIATVVCFMEGFESYGFGVAVVAIGFIVAAFSAHYRVIFRMASGETATFAGPKQLITRVQSALEHVIFTAGG